VGSGSRISSVKTHSTCIRLYKSPYCRGEFLETNSDVAYLGEVNYDEVTYSISSCHSSQKNDDCSVRHVFSSKVDIDDIVYATTALNLIRTNLTNTTVEFSCHNNSEVTSDLKILSHLFKQLEEVLLDEKVEPNFAKKTAYTFGNVAEIIISNLQRIFSPSISRGRKLMSLGITTHYCKEIDGFFTSNEFAFNSRKIIGCPYLAAVSSLCLTAADLEMQVDGGNSTDVKKYVKSLKRLNEKYLNESIGERTSLLEINWEGSTCGVEDRLVCSRSKEFAITLSLTTSTKSGDCELYTKTTSSNYCGSCRNEAVKSVETQMTRLFQPVLDKISNFQ